MNELPHFKTSEFNYSLPQDKIAIHPLTNRSDSKLLVYHNGSISNNQFKNLPSILPQGSKLVFNDTKVIPARLIFQRETGAQIEIFLVKNLIPDHTWECIIGNKAKFKELDTLYCTNDPQLTAKLVDREKNIVQLFHPDSITKAIYASGQVPLPPYFNRVPVEAYKERYQTVFAKHDGAVAAPTASLHFTKEIIDECLIQGIQHHFCTLHVGLGTFAPVKEAQIQNHPMHSERWSVSRDFIENIYFGDDSIIPVGTTALRLIETLGVIAFQINQNKFNPLVVEQGVGYTRDFKNFEPKSIGPILLDYMERNSINSLNNQTSLFILPGFHFKTAKALITNFHQPNSTLLGLVSAFTGQNWRMVYNHALQNNYRFLSYGDSSLVYLDNRGV